MTVEYLDLREDCLAAPTRWDCAVIEARMLWPHDPDMRGRYLSAVSVKVGVSSIGRVPLQEATPTEMREIGAKVREFGEAMLSAPRVEDFTARAKSAFTHGMVAGKLLYDAVGYHELDPTKAGLTAAKERIEARLWPNLRVKVKTIDNTIWPIFRSVAHFWAAHILWAMQTEDNTFPCRIADLGMFLAVGEAYRQQGESIRPSPKAPTMLLRPDESVLIPEAISLPAIEFFHASPSR